jgi:HlyD family secretion protein
MKRKKFLWTISIALVAIIGGYLGYAAVTRTADEVGQPSSSGGATAQTSVARLGDLTVSASGSGQVVPAAETELGFQESGVLVELLVQVGDEVQVGDVVARLGTDKTPTQLAADIASAELAVVKAQQALDSIYEMAEVEAAQALLAVENARGALESVYDVELETALALGAISDAQAVVQDADMDLYILNSSPTEEAIYIAYASTLFKEQDLEALIDNIEKAEHDIRKAPNPMIRDRLEEQLLNLNLRLAQQQVDYEDALYKFNHLDDEPDPIDIAVAEAQVATAQAQLAQAQREWEKIQTGPTPSEIALAESELASALAEWERVKNGPDPHDFLLAESELAIAQKNLALAQGEQAVEELVAPVDGTVIDIGVNVGEFVESGNILTLADLDQPLIEIFLDETDLDKVVLGNEVEVTFDALPGDTFTGEIVAVDPGLVEVSGVQGVRAMVQLDPASYAKPQTLPVGLNATVDVIAGRATNAVLIPVGALLEQSPGDYSVYLQDDGAFVLQKVSVGLVDFTSVEILAGLGAGDIVAIENIETMGSKQ